MHVMVLSEWCYPWTGHKLYPMLEKSVHNQTLGIRMTAVVKCSVPNDPRQFTSYPIA